MTIICTSTNAATQVLAVLIDARLTPGRQFHTEVSYPYGPPISYTIIVDLSDDLLRHLRAIPNTTIT